jgi:AbrB family looped-hinge helix DNA binding protein
MAKTAEILEISSTVTARGQTTVPAAIRKMLALGKGDQVVFRGLADGTVIIARKETCADGDDPVIGKFLEFVARDMSTNRLGFDRCRGRWCRAPRPWPRVSRPMSTRRFRTTRRERR